jgi:hypothetical protein
MGEFRLVAKHVTAATVDSKAFAAGTDSFDVPWVLEMANGKRLFGAYWHDRFGIEDGPGDIQLSPADAARIFVWTDPAVPPGWHGIAIEAPSQTVIVNVRK